MSEHSTSCVSSYQTWRSNTAVGTSEPASWIQQVTATDDGHEWEIGGGSDDAAGAGNYVVTDEGVAWMAKPVPHPSKETDLFLDLLERGRARRGDGRRKPEHPRIDYEPRDEWDLLEI